MKRCLVLLIALIMFGCSSSINANNQKYQDYLSLLHSVDKGKMHVIADLPAEGYSFNNEIDLYLDFQGDEQVEATAEMLYKTIIPFVEETKLGKSKTDEEIDHFHDYLVIFTLGEGNDKVSYTIWNNYTVSIEDNNTLFSEYEYYSCDKEQITNLIDTINSSSKERMDMIQEIYFN